MIDILGKGYQKMLVEYAEQQQTTPHEALGALIEKVKIDPLFKPELLAEDDPFEDPACVVVSGKAVSLQYLCEMLIATYVYSGTVMRAYIPGQPHRPIYPACKDIKDRERAARLNVMVDFGPTEKK